MQFAIVMLADDDYEEFQVRNWSEYFHALDNNFIISRGQLAKIRFS